MSRRQHAATLRADERPPRRDVSGEEEELDPRVQRFLRFMAATAIRSLMRERDEATVQLRNGAVESDDEET